MLKIIKDYNIYSKDNSKILLNSNDVLEAINITNEKMRRLKKITEEDAVNIFDAIDFRMLSGMLGEALITIISQTSDVLVKNPHIDGYPDLLDVSSPEKICFYQLPHSNDTPRDRFRDYTYGGIEIKNTFGVKINKQILQKGQPRISKINKKLDWKAHHENTNYLLGLYSEFIDDVPQIVAAFYSDELNSDDWKKKQNPREGSAMTSFSAIDKSGWLKMKGNLIICINNQVYLNFFEAE
jgi:hypothetical protein